MPRDRDKEEPTQTQTQQAAPAVVATKGPTQPVSPLQAPSQQDLPWEQPGVSTNYCDLRATWWGLEGEMTIEDGQSVDFPTSGVLCSPPVRGVGIVRNEITFSFDIVSGSVTAAIGTRASSEVARPLKPFCGVSYPEVTVPLIAGQRAHLIRVDIIDPAPATPESWPNDLRSWEMNRAPGVTGTNRESYPSLCPYVTAVGGRAVVRNVQIQAYAHQL